MPQLRRLIDLKRLVAGGLAVLALLLPLYMLLLRGDSDATAGARLLDTPGTGGQTRVGIEPGQFAPNFELSTHEGGRVRLAELRGRPVLLNFWASWCGSCLAEMPEIKALQGELGLEAFAVLAVNAGETRAEAGRFIDFLDAPFVYALDGDLVVSDAYAVYGLPLSVFIDAEGVVQAYYQGHADRSRLRTFITAAIEARPAVELPAVLRPITMIPRQRVLSVATPANNRVVFTSRALRCDASYCGQAAVDALATTNGIASVMLETKRDNERSLTVGYDPASISLGGVVEQLRLLLESISDPVYATPLTIRYVDK